MTVQELIAALIALDSPEAEVYFADPDRGSIIYSAETPTLEEITGKPQYAYGDYAGSSYDFEIGTKIVIC